MTGAAALPLAACSAEAGDFSETAAEAAYPPIGAFVEAAGERVHYWQRGDGPPVVLLHGASGNLRDWTFDVAPRLAARHRVTAFDRPGFGYSTRRSAGADDPAVQARILAAAARALDIERPVVVGHSYGGAVAMGWALDENPGAVVTLGGVSQPYASALGEVSRAIGLNELATSIYQRYMRANFDEGAVAAFLARVFEPQPVPEGYAAHIGAALSLRDTTMEANAADLAALHGALEEMAPRYPALRLPLVALHGTADDTVVPRQSKRLVEAVPGARLVLLDGVGHMPHHARPDALETALAEVATA